MVSNTTSDRIPVWIDCDPGHDDAFALLLAATHPRLNLLGVSTVHGNASLAQVTSNARAILQLLNRLDVAVIPGAAHARAGPPKEGGQRFHGESGLAGVTLLPPAPSSPDDGLHPGSADAAARAMRASVMAQPPGTAFIVATGALTNIAAAIQAYPEVAGHVRGLSVMGGAVGMNHAISDGTERVRWLGKDGDSGEGLRVVEFPSRWAEFNTWSDPQAAALVYGSLEVAGKITAVTLDLTYQVLAVEGVFEELFGGDGGETSLLRRVFRQTLEHSRMSYGGYYDHLPGPPLHDPLAVAVLLENLDEGLSFEDDGQRWVVDVVTEGEELGRMKVLQARGRMGVRIPRGVGAAVFWRIMKEALDRAEAVALKSGS